jgi:hypothetical protein
VAADAYPRLSASWFSSICELGPRPLVVTGWLKLWLQGHFADAANIEGQPNDPPATGLTRNLWHPDDKTTRLAIESASHWKPELTEHRPGIMIKRNPWKRMRLGIDDRMMFHLAPDAQDRYANWWQGSHTLFCIAGDGAETEKLAAEVFRELNEFGPIVRKILDLKKFEVAEVGELFKLKTTARENFVVPISTSYVYEESWKVVQEAPLFTRLLTRIDLKTFQP